MRYNAMRKGVFIARPNRFIAHVELDGVLTVCHVKNTGRCRELLPPGAEVGVQHMPAPNRRTAYDLISVRKGKRIINMDAAAPNRAFGEWVAAGGFMDDVITVKPEAVHGDSRFDFYIETSTKRVFVEVKGVTLEEDGVARFPDAPTVRGVKHLRGLIQCVRQGYEAWAVFIIQMQGVKWMEPNRATHPEFADALREAGEAGVKLLALSCDVDWDSMTIAQPVEIRL